MTTKQKLLAIYEACYFDAVFYDKLLNQTTKELSVGTIDTLNKWKDRADAKMTVCLACLSEKDKKSLLPDIRLRAVTKAKEAATCWINSRKHIKD